MSSYIRHTLRQASWDTLASMPRSKLIGLLLVLVMPGGLAVPLCYAAYVAVRNSLTR
ncbi:MAG TPA: hypothetical protein VGO08_05140 [Burkholderiales bacterium]|jgi:hypothetical protein|nr:hypothetical protein [Burkholderiales bacterium]